MLQINCSRRSQVSNRLRDGGDLSGRSVANSKFALEDNGDVTITGTLDASKLKSDADNVLWVENDSGFKCSIVAHGTQNSTFIGGTAHSISTTPGTRTTISSQAPTLIHPDLQDGGPTIPYQWFRLQDERQPIWLQFVGAISNENTTTDATVKITLEVRYFASLTVAYQDAVSLTRTVSPETTAPFYYTRVFRPPSGNWQAMYLRLAAEQSTTTSDVYADGCITWSLFNLGLQQLDFAEGSWPLPGI